MSNIPNNTDQNNESSTTSTSIPRNQNPQQLHPQQIAALATLLQQLSQNRRPVQNTTTIESNDQQTQQELNDTFNQLQRQLSNSNVTTSEIVDVVCYMIPCIVLPLAILVYHHTFGIVVFYLLISLALFVLIWMFAVVISANHVIKSQVSLKVFIFKMGLVLINM